MATITRQTQQITGRAGEDAACAFLEESGYTILCRNFRAAHDEIDVIAEDERSAVFVEVKARTGISSPRYGRPAAAVTARKRACLARAAERYIRAHPSDKWYRFDVIEVWFTHDRITGEGSYRFNHMKNVFGAGGRLGGL